MPKKSKKPSAAKGLEAGLGKELPDEALKKLEEIKSLLESFKGKVLAKFEDYVVGISLLPPSKDDSKKEKINVFLLIDDSDSKKMSKEELKEKLVQIIGAMAQEVDPRLNPEVMLLTELWQMCYDGKYEVLEAISTSAPVHDSGMLAAIKIAEVHKRMVLEKFEKYIVCYVLAGSLVQGRATHKSDIDVFIVIDDTDVKKMTRAELKDKLRAIIIGMGLDAGDLTGIKNKLNIQVYILTDFWDNLKEANPVIFTFLRDGVPFYDRGIFMPWKQLLQMGRIKPSSEAIDMYKSTGDQMLQRVKFKLKEIAMEDVFWATITPSQAALMLYGVAPPTPKETAELLRELFVKKEKLLEDKYVKIFEKVLKTRKDLEHGDKVKITGKDLDELLSEAEEYLERLKKLFTQIEELKEKESVVNAYENVVTVARQVLLLEGEPSVSDSSLAKAFKEKVVDKGFIGEKHHRLLLNVLKAKKDYDSGRLNKASAAMVLKEARELVKELVEYMERKRSKELEKAKFRVKHGDCFGEVIVLGRVAFIVKESGEGREVLRAELSPQGSIEEVSQSSQEQLDEALSSFTAKEVYLKEAFVKDLEKVFGKDFEILL